MTIEIFKNIPMLEYRAWAEKSQSTIGNAVDSIEHYLMPFKGGPALALGTAFHTDVLTPHMMDYVVAPKFDLRKTIDKQKKIIFDKTSQNKAIITPDQAEHKKHMVASVRAEPRAKEILKNCKNYELSARGTMEGADFGVKGRIDTELGKSAIDLKSTSDASPEGFAKSIYKYGYDIQAYMYKTLFGKDNFIFIVTESSEPYITEVYVLGEETIELGRQRFERACARISEYEATGIKGGYTNSSELVEINAPYWALKKEL